MAPENTSGLGPEFTYDLSALRKVHPKLVRWEQAAAVATGLQEPRGIAVGAEDRLYVAGDEAVRVFDKAGTPPAEFKTAGRPHCLAAAKDGTLYVGLKDRVVVHGPDGRQAAAWAPLGERAYLTCVAVGESDIFVADAGDRIVLRYDPAGKVAARIGQEDEAKHAPGLVVPSPYFDVALGPDGMLWVVDPGRRRVECYTYDGEFRFAWGRASPQIDGFCGCCNPSHLAILADGSFVTSEKGLPRVKVYDGEGRFREVVAAPERFAEGTAGLDLAVDSQGRVLVLDPFARQVRVFVRKKA